MKVLARSSSLRHRDRRPPPAPPRWVFALCFSCTETEELRYRWRFPRGLEGLCYEQQIHKRREKGSLLTNHASEYG